MHLDEARYRSISHLNLRYRVLDLETPVVDQLDRIGRDLTDRMKAECVDAGDDALDDLEKSRGANEEELAREQLTRVADVLKRLKERQDRLVEESARIQKEALEHKEWTRGLPEEDAEALVDSNAGKPVRWVSGEGWVEGRE